uniref:Uncharacterized protein n=1 Tax=Romanomermis culicivorax TaxID=13658 RepID=A0A915IWF1_ROMCU
MIDRRIFINRSTNVFYAKNVTRF